MPDPDTPWMEDKDFLWRAAGELLTALGCSSHLVAGLPEIRRSFGVLADLDRGDPSSHEASELRNDLEILGRRVLPLAREALRRLDAERIHPEIVGLSGAGLRTGLSALDAAYVDPAWRTMSRDELMAYGESVMERALARRDPSGSPGIVTAPVAPEHGETGRVVEVLRRMPKDTVTRVTKVWNPLALRGVVAAGLIAIRQTALAHDEHTQSSEDPSTSAPPRPEQQRTRAQAIAAARAAGYGDWSGVPG